MDELETPPSTMFLYYICDMRETEIGAESEIVWLSMCVNYLHGMQKMAFACMHAWEAPRIGEHPSHWLVAPKAASRVEAHFAGQEVNNGTWAHPVLRSRPQRSVLTGTAVWGAELYIVFRCGNIPAARPALFMLTFEIYYAINVQLSLPSFLRCSLVLKPECKWGTFL